MALRDDLASGSHGLSFAVPESFEVLHEAPGLLVARDPERTVAWEILHTKLRLDLRPEHDHLLHEDIARDARDAFESTHAEIAAKLPAAERAAPRTEDAAWSPVVEIARVTLAGAPALEIIHRLTYQPGHELITGRLLVPLAGGLMELSASHLTRVTGYRESALGALAMNEGSDREPLEAAREVKQARMDAPDYDILFPEHPLSVVRAALRWLLDEGVAGVAVPAPMPERPAGEIELPGASSTITPPARCLLISTDALPLTGSMATFTRVGLTGTAPRLFAVGRAPEERVVGAEPVKQLRRLARHTLESWASEGAKDLDITTSKLPDLDGRPQAESYARFSNGHAPRQAVARWFVDTDGAVFRVESTASPRVPTQELRDEVDAAVRSWRRLGPREPLPVAREAPRDSASAPKKWWKIW